MVEWDSWRKEGADIANKLDGSFMSSIELEHWDCNMKRVQRLDSIFNRTLNDMEEIRKEMTQKLNCKNASQQNQAESPKPMESSEEVKEQKEKGSDVPQEQLQGNQETGFPFGFQMQGENVGFDSKQMKTTGNPDFKMTEMSSGAALKKPEEAPNKTNKSHSDFPDHQMPSFTNQGPFGSGNMTGFPHFPGIDMNSNLDFLKSISNNNSKSGINEPRAPKPNQNEAQMRKPEEPTANRGGMGLILSSTQNQDALGLGNTWNFGLPLNMEDNGFIQALKNSEKNLAQFSRFGGGQMLHGVLPGIGNEPMTKNQGAALKSDYFNQSMSGFGQNSIMGKDHGNERSFQEMKGFGEMANHGFYGMNENNPRNESGVHQEAQNTMEGPSIPKGNSSNSNSNQNQFGMGVMNPSSLFGLNLNVTTGLSQMGNFQMNPGPLGAGELFKNCEGNKGPEASKELDFSSLNPAMLSLMFPFLNMGETGSQMNLGALNPLNQWNQPMFQQNPMELQGQNVFGQRFEENKEKQGSHQANQGTASNMGNLSSFAGAFQIPGMFNGNLFNFPNEPKK